MIFLTISVFLSCVLYSDASVWRFLRESEPEVIPIEVVHEEPIHHDRRCYEDIRTCTDRFPEPLSPAEHDGVLTFYDCHIDSVCSIAEQLLPCIKGLTLDPEMCYEESVMIQRISELYNFGCITNRSDMYNLIDCANNKRVQEDIFIYTSMIRFGGKMLRKLERTGIVIPDDVKNSLICWLFEGFAIHISSSVYSCGEEAEATVRRLIPSVVPLLLTEEHLASFDFSTCTNWM